jgi:hypothetical protein
MSTRLYGGIGKGRVTRVLSSVFGQESRGYNAASSLLCIKRSKGSPEKVAVWTIGNEHNRSCTAA